MDEEKVDLRVLLYQGYTDPSKAASRKPSPVPSRSRISGDALPERRPTNRRSIR